MKATQIVWEKHGLPAVTGCSELRGVCFACGSAMSRGLPTDKWLRSSYTDQNRAKNPTSECVCEACAYLHGRKSPVLGRPPAEGRKFGGNFRNYSHLYSYDWAGAAFGKRQTVAQYANASKGEKPLILSFLGREHGGPWFAAIADSGQKHLLPFTPMNGPGRGGVVRFEESYVAVPPSLELVHRMSHLLTVCATKEELSTAGYSPRAWSCGELEIRRFEEEFASERASEWFGLALWLAQRDEQAVIRFKGRRKR